MNQNDSENKNTNEKHKVKFSDDNTKDKEEKDKKKKLVRKKTPIIHLEPGELDKDDEQVDEQEKKLRLYYK